MVTVVVGLLLMMPVVRVEDTCATNVWSAGAGAGASDRVGRWVGGSLPNLRGTVLGVFGHHILLATDIGHPRVPFDRVISTRRGAKAEPLVGERVTRRLWAAGEGRVRGG